MNKLRFAILGLAILVAAASSVRAQSQYIGYVYPAGGQQGTTFPIRLGGQGLVHASDVVVSGEGVSVRLVDYYRVMGNRGNRVAQPATQRVEEEGDDAQRRAGRQDGLVRVSRAHRPGGRAETGRKGVEERTSQVREGSGQAEADRTDRKEVRGRRAQPGRSFPNRARLCRGHGGARRQTGPARDPGDHQAGRLQPAALLRGPGARSRPQADEDLSAPGARQRVSGPAQEAAGRRGAAHHGAVHDERPDRRGRGEPVSFSGEQGAASGHLRQGPGIGALRRRRRSRLVPSRDEALRRQRQGVGVQRRFPFQSRPADLFRGSRGRRVCADHPRGAVSRPRELRVSHYHRRAALRDQHLPVGRPRGRARQDRDGRLEPGKGHARAAPPRRKAGASI